MESQIKSQFYLEFPKERVTQGDILKDLVLISYDGIDESNNTLFTKTSLNYAIVLSQDCDLEHDYNYRKNQVANNDKFLSNIIILAAYLMNDFKSGIHRGDKIKGITWGGEAWKLIKGNRDARFHYIEGDTKEFQIPELIIDFKQVYTIKREVLYSNLQSIYVATICELYRENISQRYTNYLSRIGLPDKTTT